MRSLFIKIFVWFWLAIVLVAGAAVASAVWLHPGNDREAAHWRHFVGNMLSVQGRSAIEIYERNGREALAEHIQREQSAIGHRFYLFSSRGDELTGRTVAKAAGALAEQAAQGGPGEVSRSDDATLAAVCIGSQSGESYVLVGELPAGPLRAASQRAARRPTGTPLASRVLRDVWSQPRILALVLLAVVVTGGLVCYALARYLTSPVRKLSAATRALASGALAVRVGPQLGKRRDEFGALAGDFDSMAARLEDLLARQHQLLRDISHELRSPLARLGVALGLARRGVTPEAGLALDRIEREAGRLNELIGQLLELTRLESETEPRDPVPVSLVPLLQDIAADAGFEVAGRDRRVQIAAGADAVVLGSPELLRRALENVIRNAVHYTPDGSQVEVIVSHVRAARSYVRIEVRDHGPGVPAAALRDIFRPFYRVADARDRATGGVGLGLAITERAIRLHGGQVSAAGATGGGLCVMIDLPAGDEP